MPYDRDDDDELDVLLYEALVEELAGVCLTVLPDISDDGRAAVAAGFL